mgnify:CR=1 FL=1
MTSSLARLVARLAGHTRRVIEAGDSCPAAVLVPIVMRSGEPWLVFTQRHADLRSHGGQISFPGGKTDEGDADPAATARREACEELGLLAPAIRVLGVLDDIATPTGFVITPVVALVEPPPATYSPCADEVAEVFELPVERLADPATRKDHGDIEYQGRTYRVHAYCVDERVIWGATGRILDQVLAMWG